MIIFNILITFVNVLKENLDFCGDKAILDTLHYDESREYITDRDKNNPGVTTVVQQSLLCDVNLVRLYECMQKHKLHRKLSG